MTPDAMKAWLKRMGLTQVEASKVLSVTQRTISRWVRGNTLIPHVVELACQRLEYLKLKGNLENSQREFEEFDRYQ